MAETIRTRRLAWRALFLMLATTVAFVQLLPTGGADAGLPGPDVLVLLAIAWVLRRPDYVPALLIAGVMLAADFLFVRPPGLWAAITVLATEFFRARAQASRDLPFLIEWATVGFVCAVMTLGEALVLLILMVPQPPLGLTLIQLILTIACYPLVVVVSVFGLGLRRPAPGEVDELGHPL